MNLTPLTPLAYQPNLLVESMLSAVAASAATLT